MSVPGVAVSKVEPAIDVRSITILGATGSVGASTVDLIKREPERYRVESVSARRNAAALGKIARDIGARHAVVADPAAYRDLKSALSGSRIEAAAGEEALIEAAQRPADWVMASISGSVGLKPTMAALQWLSRTRSALSARAACSCDALRAQAQPFCLWTPNTMRCFRRLGPDIAPT